MLEVFALKQQNNSLKQELSVALYTQDAATRVVARLIKERDAAREYVQQPPPWSSVADLSPQSSCQRIRYHGSVGSCREWGC